MRYIIDASVAVKWFIPEDLSDAADALLAGDHEFYAPDFLLIEAANVFWKKARSGHMTPAQADDSLRLLSSGVIDFRATQVLLPRALEMAATIQHPVYDCIYMAAAEAWQAVLVTADRRLVGALDRGGWGLEYSVLNH